MKELEDAAAIVKELRLAQGDGTDWTEDLFARAADVIESLSAPPTEDEAGYEPEETCTVCGRDDLLRESLPYDSNGIAEIVCDGCAPVWRNRHREPSNEAIDAAARALYGMRLIGGSGYEPKFWEPRARAALEAAESTRTGGDT